MGCARFTHILIPLPVPSLQHEIDQDLEISRPWKERMALITYLYSLWQQRVSHDHTPRIWHLFHNPIPLDTTTPSIILHYWREWERLHVFGSILCVTSPHLPHHYVLLAQSGSERWILAYWGPTELDALTGSRLLRWLSAPLPGILMTVGWGVAGVIALIAFLYVLDGSPESVDPPMNASLLLYGGILCGLLTITIEPALQWLTTHLFAPPQCTHSSDQGTFRRVGNL